MKPDNRRFIRTVIRTATADDAAAVHKLILQLAESIPSQQKLRSSPSDFENAMTGSHPAIRALLAEYDGKPVGVLAFFTTFSTWYGTPGVYVQDIYVDESARGDGVGQRLLAAVSKWGIEHNADHLRLSVDRCNAAAADFYGKNRLLYCEDEKIYMIEGDAMRRLGGDQ